jgi:hypothetical protein
VPPNWASAAASRERTSWGGAATRVDPGDDVDGPDESDPGAPADRDILGHLSVADPQAAAAGAVVPDEDLDRLTEEADDDEVELRRVPQLVDPESSDDPVALREGLADAEAVPGDEDVALAPEEAALHLEEGG